MDAILRVFGEHALTFAGSPLNSGSRLFVGYLLTSLLAAWLIYHFRKPAGGFRAFLMPDSVWSHPHAWLDVRYFFFHALIGKLIIKGAGVGVFALGLTFAAGAETDLPVIGMDSEFGPALSAAIILGFYLIALVVNDFISFYLHYLQHRIPVLWQFHKVHHAGEVMHPLSNFREHPIDNLTYDVGTSLVRGLLVGLFMSLVGMSPSGVIILGVSLGNLVFNGVAYSLRHSHIWLRWPGRWSMVFGSPAHHQVHHSRHPDHLDTNFAFMFPVWDVIFGTYCMPEDNRDVEFGIVEDSSELNSCVNLYVVPFRDAWRVMTKRSRPYHVGASRPADTTREFIK